MSKIIRIYFDANVLIDYMTNQINVVQTVDYLFKQRERETLFTSTLAIAQMISALQTRNKHRKAYTKKVTCEAVDFFATKMTILDLTQRDIELAKSANGEDLEDCIQFTLSKKRKCHAILTRNKSDFSKFDKVRVISPILTMVKQVIH